MGFLEMSQQILFIIENTD